MKQFFLLVMILLITIGCNPEVKSNKKSTEVNPIVDPSADAAPLSYNINSVSMLHNGSKTIILPYLDTNQDKADNCIASDLTHLTSTDCVCSNGICSVTISSERNYSGDANFKFAVRANGLYSNFSTVSINVFSAVSIPASTPIALDSSSTLTYNGSQIIILGYSDAEGDKATSCTVSNVNHLTIVNPCSCDASGVCTVNIQAENNYSGAASFISNVTANGATSNNATNTVSINPANVVDHPPATNPINNIQLNFNSTKTITLGYTDQDGDLATSCTVSNLNHVSESTPCSCNNSGVCTVGIRGQANYSGTANFIFNVTANGATSNSAVGSVFINAAPAVNHPPIATNSNNTQFGHNSTRMINLSYSDQDGDKADHCTISNPAHLVIATTCMCDVSGVCMVEMRTETGYSGAASFRFSVRANGQTSNNATISANVSVAPIVNHPPVSQSASNIQIDHNGTKTITLGYSDSDNDLASSCAIISLSHLSISNACSCNNGVCTVGVRSETNYSGAASFRFAVHANGQTSNTSTIAATVAAAPVNHPPVATSFTNNDLQYNGTIMKVLNFTDQDGDSASGCSVSQLQHLTATSACTCSGNACSVNFRAETNFSGSASFRFVIMVNGQTSNLAIGIFNISAPTVSYNDYTSINFDVKKSADGLPRFFTRAPVYAGTFLSNGDLLVGSVAGLAISRNGGDSFTPIPSSISQINDIRAIYQDSSETIFIGGSGGIAVSTNNGVSYTKKMIENDINNSTHSITKFNSKLYVGAHQGLFVSENNGDVFTKIDICAAGSNINHLYTRDNQTLYISTYNCGLYTLSSTGVLTNYNADNDGLASDVLDVFKDNITGVTIDNNGTIYIASNGGGVAISDDNLQTFANKKIGGRGFFSSVTTDSDGTLILGTNGYGLYVTLDKGDTYANLTPTANNLPLKTNSTLAADIYGLLTKPTGELYILTDYGLAIDK